MKELLAIITISFMEAVGFIGFIAGLLGLDLSDMGFERFAELITVVSVLVFIFICTYLYIKQDRKNKMSVKSGKNPTEIEQAQKKQNSKEPVKIGHVRPYTQIRKKSIQTEYTAEYTIAYKPGECRKSAKNGMCA